MISEVGMEVASAAKAFLTDIINKTRSVTGGKGLGVFYWEPECHADWQGYTMGAFGRDGRPTEALDAYKQVRRSGGVRISESEFHPIHTVGPIAAAPRMGSMTARIPIAIILA